MTNKLTILLSGRGLAQIKDTTILSYISRRHNTIHQQAIGIYIHWVILGMELEYEALGYTNKQGDA